MATVLTLLDCLLEPRSRKRSLILELYIFHNSAGPISAKTKEVRGGAQQHSCYSYHNRLEDFSCDGGQDALIVVLSNTCEDPG